MSWDTNLHNVGPKLGQNSLSDPEEDFLGHFMELIFIYLLCPVMLKIKLGKKSFGWILKTSVKYKSLQTYKHTDKNTSHTHTHRQINSNLPIVRSLCSFAYKMYYT